MVVLVVLSSHDTQTHTPQNSFSPSLPKAMGNPNRPLLRFGHFPLRADHHMYLKLRAATPRLASTLITPLWYSSKPKPKSSPTFKGNYHIQAYLSYIPHGSPKIVVCSLEVTFLKGYLTPNSVSMTLN